MNLCLVLWDTKYFLKFLWQFTLLSAWKSAIFYIFTSDWIIILKNILAIWIGVLSTSNFIVSSP